MYVSGCVRLYCGCVVFVCVSGHVYMVTVGVCIGVCMFVNVCDCMVVVLSPAMLVWRLCVFACVSACL